jgi:hypothetical protein
MFRIRRIIKGLFAIALGLAPVGSATAGPILDWLGIGDNPPQSYSPARYWAPAIARLNDEIHGPRLPVYAPDRHPEINPGHTILTYPSAVAVPADTLIPLPTPPATSVAR